jgi:cell division protein ZapA
MSELIELTIMNQRYKISSDKDKKYLEQLASYVNSKADEISKKSRSVDSLNVAVLTALNIADDFFTMQIETNSESARILEKANKVYQYMLYSSVS